MAKFPYPENLNSSHPEQWPEWSLIHRYREARKILYVLGKEAKQVQKTFTFFQDPNDYGIVMTKLDTNFVPKVNAIHRRAKRFSQHIQKQGEMVEDT